MRGEASSFLADHSLVRLTQYNPYGGDLSNPVRSGREGPVILMKGGTGDSENSFCDNQLRCRMRLRSAAVAVFRPLGRGVAPYDSRGTVYGGGFVYLST